MAPTETVRAARKGRNVESQEYRKLYDRTDILVRTIGEMLELQRLHGDTLLEIRATANDVRNRLAGIDEWLRQPPSSAIGDALAELIRINLVLVEKVDALAAQ